MTELGVGAQYLARLPSPDTAGMRPTWNQIEQGLNAVIADLPHDSEAGVPSKKRFVEIVVQHTLERIGGQPGVARQGFGEEFARQFSQLANALRTDNLVVDDRGKIVGLVAGPAGELLSSWLENKLADLQWNVALIHLRESLRCFADGQWAASNGQLRTFLEELFNQIHAARHPGCNSLEGDARQHLVNLGFVEANYENGLLRRIFGYLGSAGSHAGASDRDESAYHHGLALATGVYFLRRFAH